MAAFVLLATLAPGTGSAECSGPPYTSYCRKDLLQTDDGVFRCNWWGSFEAACEFVSPSNVEVQRAAVVTEPASVGRCGTGEEIVRVTYQ